jgi:phosphate transport system protein
MQMLYTLLVLKGSREERAMQRTNLDRGLQELHTQVVHLGSRVERSLAKTLKSLETGDHTSLPLLIESSSLMLTLCTATEQRTLRLLILQQPLGGRDLRYLTAAFHLAIELGWIGEATVEMAQALLRAAALYQLARALSQRNSSSPYSVDLSPLDPEGNITDSFILRGLLNLGTEVHYILRTTLEAFRRSDADLAREVVGAGEQSLVDLRYLPLCQDILTMLAKASALSALQYDASLLQRASYLLWIAHLLQQMGNHATNIGKQIIFIEEGEEKII